MVAVAVEVWAVVVVAPVVDAAWAIVEGGTTVVIGAVVDRSLVALVVVDAAWAIVEVGITVVIGAVRAVADRSLVAFVFVDAAWAIVEDGTTVVVVGEAWVVAVVVEVKRELAVVSWEKDKQ